MSDVPWIEASTIGSEEAHATWALAARMRLEEVARDYHAVIRIADLGDWVQERSRVRTRQQTRHWIGDVLYRTMLDNIGRGEPFLCSLVVDQQGRVGANYAGLVEHLRGIRVVDADHHAADERLDCYRHFGAELPEGGGVPGPHPSAAAPRRTSSGTRSTRPTSGAAPRKSATGRVARSDVVPKICPTCFMALPASGVCDDCG